MFFRNFFHHINQETSVHARMNQSKNILHEDCSMTYQGQGIGIALLDTGISPVDDFLLPENRIVAFRDFVNGKDSPYDDNGHGTHVWYQFLNVGYIYLDKCLPHDYNQTIIVQRL